MTGKTERIAALNDQARKEMGVASIVLMTPGVNALSDHDKNIVREIVQSYATFDEDNDPHGERDFGSICQLSNGEWTSESQPYGKDGGDNMSHRLFWKIDYYDLSMVGLSNDPSNPEITQRVLTIMLAQEY